MGHLRQPLPRDGVVDHDVAGRIVVAELVLHRNLGMPFGNVVQLSGTSVFRGPEEQLKVHHVVDDGVVRPSLLVAHSRPGVDGPHDRVEKQGQGVCGTQEALLVFGISREPVSVPEAAEKHESQVMAVAFLVEYRNNRFRELFRPPSDLLVVCELVVVPQDSGPEPAGPIIDVGAAPLRVGGVRSDVAGPFGRVCHVGQCPANLCVAISEFLVRVHLCVGGA